MKTNSTFASIFCLLICSHLSGCASIISGRHANVAIDSYPTNAHVTVHDKDGRAVASITTPGVVSLERNRKYFLPAQYTATIEAPGYAPTEVPIQSKLNPWILGNIVVGGVPGLIVDNATGAAWQPKQSEIHSQLMPLSGPMQGPMISAATPQAPALPPSPQYVAERTQQVAPANVNAPNTVRPVSTY